MYPEWFLDMIYNDEDKERAIEGTLKSNEEIEFICSVHGVYRRLVKSVIRITDGTKKSDCPKCGQLRSSKAGNTKESRAKANASRRKDPDYREKQRANSLKKSQACIPFPAWFIEDLAFEEDKQKAKDRNLKMHDKVGFKCDKHGTYYQLVNSHIHVANLERKCGCPLCVQGNYRSSLEDTIDSYIQSLRNLEVIKNSRFLLGCRKEIDLYYPELSLAFEINGSYYHASVGGRENYTKTPQYHQEKFKLCEDKGIHLVSIFDVDWFAKEEKIKSYIKSLVLPSNKIYARECTIQTVDNSVAMTFEESYHLQGYSYHSQTHLALFHKGQIVSVMSFGKPRFGYSKYDYELHRYCVKEGYTVVGGAEKLFKKFIKDNKGIILSYSDNDYFTGSIYQRLGFVFDGYTNPGYYWCRSNYQVLEREECQLKKLKTQYPKLYEESEGKGNREDYIMSSLGYMKVYRSGNKRWVYKGL